MWDSLPYTTSLSGKHDCRMMLSAINRIWMHTKQWISVRELSDLLRHCESASQLDPPCDLGLHEQGDGSSLLRFNEPELYLRFFFKGSNLGGPSIFECDILSAHVACDAPNGFRRSQSLDNC